MDKTTRILVTGATGYVGGRLVPRLLEAGYAVRVLVRGGRARLNGRPWRDAVEVAEGDVLRAETLSAALTDVDAAYYLIHSISGSAQYAARDQEAARNFAAAAEATATEAAGVQQIIYLGGLGDGESQQLSEHLRSRQETGDALRSGAVPVTEFRAGMVVGSGSLSFEMLRHLAERLPVMLAPSWVFTRTQPIAIRDVLSYLLAALETPASRGEIIEIGGADIVSYADMMQTYARLRGLRRFMLRVPVLTPGLSSHWVHWVTPISARMARPLIEGLRNELLVRSTRARELFPAIAPLGFAAAVELALARLKSGRIETVWSDALASSQGDVQPVYLMTQEQGFLIERREMRVAASPAQVFAAFTAIGGAQGWPPYHFLWEIRGLLDRLVGGVGMRRRRRDPHKLVEGDALDFWRVETVQPDESIVLRAEMKLPGLGWLKFEAVPDASPNSTRLVQTAYFAPKGAFGLLYWYGLYPLHAVVFSGMLRHIARQAEAIARPPENRAAGQSGQKISTPMLQLRAATAEDQSAIRALVQSARLNPLGLDWPDFVVVEDIAAESAVEIGADSPRPHMVGVGQIRRHRDGAQELASIAVDPAYHGQGIGRTLIATLLPRASGALYLFCRGDMAPYYTRFGFVTVGPAQLPGSLAWRLRLGQFLMGLISPLRSKPHTVIAMHRPRPGT